MIHTFDTRIAELCGMKAAVVFSYIQSRIEENRKINKNNFAGTYWEDISVKELQGQLNYLSTRGIECAIQKLEKSSLLKSAYLNPDKMNRTKWYSITDKALEIIQGGK